MKTLGIGLLSLILCFCCYSQDAIDSLSSALIKSSGSSTADIHNQIASHYLNSNPQLVLEEVNKVLNTAEYSKYKPAIAEALRLKGEAHSLLSDYDIAIHQFDKALFLYDSLQSREASAYVYGARGKVFVRKSNYKKAAIDFEKCLEIFESIHDQQGLAHAHSNFGMLYEYEGKFEAALTAYSRSLEIINRLGLENTRITMNLYIDLGIIYSHLNFFERSLGYYLKGLSIAESKNDQLSQAKVYNGIGILYNEQGKNPEALIHYQKSLDRYKLADIKMRIGLLMNNIGVAHTDLNNLNQALSFHLRSLSMRKSEGNRSDIAQSMRNIGEVYQLQGYHEKAISFYKQALETEPAGWNQAIVFRNLGEIHTQQKRYGSGEDYLKKALALEQTLESIDGQMDVHKALSTLYELKNDPHLALVNFKKYSAYKDSLLNTKENDQFKALQIIYETALKEEQLANKQQELDILQQQKKIDLFWRNVFFIGSVLLILVILFVYIYFKSRSAQKQKLLEAQTKLNDQLSEIDTMKSQFFANISHEFRTPLTLILGPLDNLIAKSKDQNDLHQLALMRTNASKLHQLINQLLELSKIDNGKLTLKASNNDIVGLAKGIFYSFQSLSNHHQISQVFACGENQIFMFYDPEKMERILMNILSNAFKFTKAKGKVSISISRKQVDNVDGVAMVIEDSGIGIEKGHLPYIFDRFYQVNKSDIREFEGTGIGLALTKELTVLHHGSIHVESQPNKGTSFQLWFPSGNAHLSQGETTAFSQDLSHSNTEPGIILTTETVENTDNFQTLLEKKDKPILLIVEDHQDLRNFIKDIFTESYNIIEANHGQQGLELALKYTPDLIISDIMMPIKNGYELCKQLKSDIQTSHIPIILLTAKSDETDRLKGLNVEADDYLTKPFNAKELKARVKNLIATRKKLQAFFASSVMIKPKTLPLNSMEEVFLQQLMEHMEMQVGNETFSVEQLSELMGMSRVHLHRKMQSIMNCTPSNFIQRFRLERATDLLSKNTGTIAEISYAVGFSSPAYFAKCFKDLYGYTPKQHNTNILSSN